jgi:hypothetical protein
MARYEARSKGNGPAGLIARRLGWPEARATAHDKNACEHYGTYEKSFAENWDILGHARFPTPIMLIRFSARRRADLLDRPLRSRGASALPPV